MLLLNIFPVRDIILYALATGAMATIALSAWPWARKQSRFVIAGAATTAGFMAWNLTLNKTDATGFNVDAPVVQISWADAGSGALAFVCVAVALTVYAPRERAQNVVGAAAIAAAVAVIVDIFVL